jgi:MFS family permease
LIGLRKTVLLGYLPLFLYFFLVYNIGKYAIPLYIIALLYSLWISLYWFPMHIWITNISNKEKIGNDLGKFFAFPKLLSMLAPAIAGIIAVFLGFKDLFIFAGIVYFISAIPLLFLPEFPYKQRLKPSKILELFRGYKQYFWAETIENMREDAEGIIWPIFVFITFKSILSVGYISTLGSIGAALFALLVGKYSDKINRQKIMLGGAVIMATLWIIRFFVTSQIAFYATTLCVGFFEALILIPLNSVVYKTAELEGGPQFVIFREFPVAIGRIILYAIAILVAYNVRYVFVLPALAGFYFIHLSRKNIGMKKVSA